MTQYQEIEIFLQKIAYSLQVQNNQVSVQDIEEALWNWNIPINLQKQLIDEKEYEKILQALNYKNEDFICSYIVQNPQYGESWQFFKTVSNLGGNPTNFKGKMYIPIKPEFIGSFSRQIIKFLIDEKIISDCKVANTYRSDSLIINVLSEQDAQKIVDFIMDSELKEALGIHHPFIPDYEGIGVIGGHDKENSYTGRISDALFKFVSECKRHNQYNMINFDTFLLTLEESLKAGRVSNYLSIEQIIKNLKKIKLAHLEKEKNKNLASIN